MTIAKLGQTRRMVLKSFENLIDEQRHVEQIIEIKQELEFE